jgi:aspartyl-tRNA(Asn)/glutamyl-tRNA(Gln) amidotransferase subunit C
LAKLELTHQEKIQLQRELDKIIKYIDQLNELNTEHLSPTFHPIPLENIVRKDKVGSSLSKEQTLANAPKKKDGFFRVPRVIGCRDLTSIFVDGDP